MQKQQGPLPAASRNSSFFANSGEEQQHSRMQASSVAPPDSAAAAGAAPTGFQPPNSGYWMSNHHPPWYGPWNGGGGGGGGGGGEVNQDPMRVSLHTYRGAILVALVVAAILVIWTFYTRHLSPLPTISPSTRAAIDTSLEQIKETLDLADKSRAAAVASLGALAAEGDSTTALHVARADAMMQVLMHLVPPQKALKCRTNKHITRGQLALRLQSLKKSLGPEYSLDASSSSSSRPRPQSTTPALEPAPAQRVLRASSDTASAAHLTIDSFDAYG